MKGCYPNTTGDVYEITGYENNHIIRPRFFGCDDTSVKLSSCADILSNGRAFKSDQRVLGLCDDECWTYVYCSDVLYPEISFHARKFLGL
jgi:hypothetical protein